MQIIGMILLVGLFIYAFQLAVVLLLLAGLIFRTKETIGLIVILALFAGLAAFPVAGFASLAAFIVAAIVKACKAAPKQVEVQNTEED